MWALTFAISAMFAAIAGIMLLGFTGSAFARVGEPYLFQSIAAVSPPQVSHLVRVRRVAYYNPVSALPARWRAGDGEMVWCLVDTKKDSNPLPSTPGAPHLACLRVRVVACWSARRRARAVEGDAESQHARHRHPTHEEQGAPRRCLSGA